MIRCAFRCESVTPQFEGATAHNVVLRAQYQQDNPTPEEQRFSRYTPCGHLEAVIDNPAAIAQLEVGKLYYLDISEAPEA